MAAASMWLDIHLTVGFRRAQKTSHIKTYCPLRRWIDCLRIHTGDEISEALFRSLWHNWHNVIFVGRLTSREIMWWFDVKFDQLTAASSQIVGDSHAKPVRRHRVFWLRSWRRERYQVCWITQADQRQFQVLPGIVQMLEIFKHDSWNNNEDKDNVYKFYPCTWNACWNASFSSHTASQDAPSTIRCGFHEQF